jgi:hypothetical protein
MHECVRDSVISDWLARKLMGNNQVAGALKMVITKVSMVAQKCQLVVTISSLQGHGRGKRGSNINSGHYKKVNRAWWKKEEKRKNW